MKHTYSEEDKEELLVKCKVLVNMMVEDYCLLFVKLMTVSEQKGNTARKDDVHMVNPILRTPSRTDVKVK